MRSNTLLPRLRGNIPLKAALFLTLLRIIISPLFVLFYLYPTFFGISNAILPVILMVLLAISEATDFLDGFVARKWDQVTDLGKLLDPMSDTLARISMFFAFTQGAIQLPLVLVLLFFYRELSISLLRTLCAMRGFALAARKSGKVKAILQAIASFVLVGLFAAYNWRYIELDVLQDFSFYTVLFVAIYTVGSGIEYIVANRRYIVKAWT